MLLLLNRLLLLLLLLLNRLLQQLLLLLDRLMLLLRRDGQIGRKHGHRLRVGEVEARSGEGGRLRLRRLRGLRGRRVRQRVRGAGVRRGRGSDGKGRGHARARGEERARCCGGGRARRGERGSSCSSGTIELVCSAPAPAPAPPLHHPLAHQRPQHRVLGPQRVPEPRLLVERGLERITARRERRDRRLLPLAEAALRLAVLLARGRGELPGPDQGGGVGRHGSGGAHRAATAVEEVVARRRGR